MAKRVWSCWLDCPILLLNVNRNVVDIATEILETGSSSDLEIFFGAA